MPTERTAASSHVNEGELTYIASAIQGPHYGSIEKIVIHDSRIVQIERKEHFRFDGAR